MMCQRLRLRKVDFVLGAFAILTLLYVAISGVHAADIATDTPPLIGKIQVLGWDGVNTGQTDNSPLDGTIVSAAFGGPDNIAPPGSFATEFIFDGVLGQFRPRTVDVAVTTPAINPTDRDQNWIYAFQIVNDGGGSDGIKGVAAINNINVSLPPCTSGIDNAFPDTINSIPGFYCTEFGGTDIGDPTLINFFQITVQRVGVGQQFSLIYGPQVIQSDESSQIFFYYSPFGPSNRNMSINGGEGGAGQALAHATIPQVVTAQFYPFFNCDTLIADTNPMNGPVIPITASISNANRSLDPISTDPTVVGNVLRIDTPGGSILQHERVDLTFTADAEAAGCIEFRATPNGPPVPGSFIGTLDIDKDSTLQFTFFVFVRPDFFDTCTGPITINNLLEAQPPYDADPPFEGHTKFGSPTVPSLDTDLDVDGVSCSVDIAVPNVTIDKQVQFLNLSDPANPIPIPPTPVEQVDSPPCGCVKFTITVTADPMNGENLTNFVLTDKLPPEMMFMGVIESSPPGITAVESPPGSGCIQVGNLPDLGPGQSAILCFKACVRPGADSGVITNTADVIATGVDSGIPTSNPMDGASVNVVPISFTLNGLGVSDNIICPPQNVVFGFEVCNTGNFPLEITVPMVALDSQLGFVSQNPVPGTMLVLDPGACQTLQVTAIALSGGPANQFQNCATFNNVTAHPQHVDPTDTRCDLTRSLAQCVDVIDPNVSAICVEVVPTTGFPGDTVQMTKRVTNTGNVTLGPITVTCVPDSDLTLSGVPMVIGPIDPGQSVEFTFNATISSQPTIGNKCVDCTYVAHPIALPLQEVDCDRTATSQCCVEITFPPPVVLIDKKVQFLDLTDPANPVAIPPMPIQQIQAPPCGCVLFTITVTADSNNLESITNFTFTDLLPAGLMFMNMVSSTPPGITGLEGPPGTITFAGVPDLGPGQSSRVSFKACVNPGTNPGPQVNSSTVQAIGAVSGIPTNQPSDPATVMVMPLDLSFLPVAVRDPVICSNQQTVFTFELCNTGNFPLEVTVPAAVGDSQLQIVSQNPTAGTVVLLNPTACQTVTVTALALSGGAPNDFQNCVSLNDAIGHPDRVDPNDTRCDLLRSTSDCIDVIDPSITAVCFLVDPTMPLPGASVQMVKRLTNTGNVTLDTVALNCTIDPLLNVNPPIPSVVGPIAPGQTLDVTIMATVSPNATPQQVLCIQCDYNAHPAALPPGNTSCNRTAQSECCATVGFPPPVVQIDKAVQFLDLTNPGNPMPLPPTPVDQVDSPPCGCVRFTIRITADSGNFEDLTNFTFNDVLPPGLMFMNMVQSTPPGITATQGPPGTVTFNGVPNLSPGQSATVSFRACVDPGTNPGLLTNVSTVRAVGATSGLPTNTPMDPARVNVVPINLTFLPVSVSNPIICPDQQTTFTFEVCNTGNWPLLVRVPAAASDAQLSIISQNPTVGTIVTLHPTDCFSVQIVAQALPGGAINDFQNCVRVNNLIAHPEQVDPTDNRCDLTRNTQDCVDVIDPRVEAVCTLVDPDPTQPGNQTRMVKTITNTGNVTLDTIAVNCQIDTGLGVPGGSIPSTVGPVAPGQSITIDFMATVDPAAIPETVLCVDCSYNAHPIALPAQNTSCNRTATSRCCVTVGFPPPVVRIDKRVQFLDLTDPANPVALPPSPVDQVNSPPCGCVRFTIDITADPDNFENLNSFTFTDLLPAGMTFMNMVTSIPPGITGVEGPPGTVTFLGVPDLTPGQSVRVTFKACVNPGVPPGVLTNSSSVAAVGVISSLPTNTAIDTARVNVVPLNLTFNPLNVSDPVICPDQNSTVRFEVCNTGQWALEVTIPAAQADAFLQIVTQDPTSGTIVTLAPTECATIEVVVTGIGGGPVNDFQNCVRLNNLIAHPDQVDPADTRCDLTRNAENCLDVIDPDVDAICFSVNPDPTRPGEQTRMIKRITNTGNVALDTIAVSCTIDPLLAVNPASIPTTVGPLNPGDSVDIDFMATVDPNAVPNDVLCVTCAYTAHPANLPAQNTSCNRSTTSECCVTVAFPPPVVMIDKQVQFLDLADPENPVEIPASPLEQVDSPPCGCVKFTITVTADAGNFEDITSFQLSDLLPAGLSFGNRVVSVPAGVTAVEGPPGTLTFSGLPNLGPGESVVVCFRACVEPGTPPGVLINSSTVEAVGVISGIPTNTDTDNASVNVVPVDIEVTSLGASDDLICPPQTSTITFALCNTGNWPLDVTIPAATADLRLDIVSQDPAVGTVVTIGPGNCSNVEVVVRALPGGLQINQCVDLSVTGHPTLVDPNDERCDVTDSAQQCIDVIDPQLEAQCFTVSPPTVSPGEMVSFTKRVINTGNVELSSIEVSCVLDPDLTVPMGGIPSDLGSLMPGESVDFTVVATVGPGASPGTDLCIDCTYIGHPAPLAQGDTSCDTEAASQCCVFIDRDRIPTLSEWGLILMGLAFCGLLVLRGRRSA